MDYNAEYIDLLKKALAAETETVRLYLAIMAIAPNSALKRLLLLARRYFLLKDFYLTCTAVKFNMLLYTLRKRRYTPCTNLLMYIFLPME